ncbi:MAG: very short patch repair endonuclease [Bacteroidaceae bacterium]|nr:very short patch repair endonuclease [Bacteroidaceae bacterium]
MDHLTPQQRHKNMAAIRGKNTKPEMIVRKGLWKRGFRYRLNHRRLPGHPDLVLRKYRTCIFVNGCFWHGHNTQFIIHNSQFIIDSAEQKYHNSQLTTSNKSFIIESSECCKIPRTNREFWVAKIRRNMERDREDQRKLAELGWHCITVWECELKASKREETLDSIAYTLNHIWLQDRRMKSRNYGITEDEEVQLMAAEEGEDKG